MDEQRRERKARLMIKYQVPYQGLDLYLTGKLVVPCALCQVIVATDLHEIISRAYVPVEYQNDIPDCYHALLCRRCNLRHGEINPDTRQGRELLIRRNAKYYGEQVMRDEYERFNDLLPIPLNLFYLDDVFEEKI